MPRLDKQRQEELEPIRIQTAMDALKNKGLNPVNLDKEIRFEYKGQMVYFWPYSGWHSGVGIRSGRGLLNLLKQLHP